MIVVTESTDIVRVIPACSDLTAIFRVLHIPGDRIVLNSVTAARIIQLAVIPELASACASLVTTETTAPVSATTVSMATVAAIVAGVVATSSAILSLERVLVTVHLAGWETTVIKRVLVDDMVRIVSWNAIVREVSVIQQLVSVSARPVQWEMTVVKVVKKDTGVSAVASGVNAGNMRPGVILLRENVSV